MKYLFVIGISFFYSFSFAQDSTNHRLFAELVTKAQNDKSLRGTFIYKGTQAQIEEYTEYKTAIGKFIKVIWTPSLGTSYQAIFHNTLGYMTRNLFKIYARAYSKENKVGDNKYCKGNSCIELVTTNKLPYYTNYYRLDSEIKVIE